MTVGIISEGRSDRAVLTNILHGLIALDDLEIIALRPKDITDETDKASLPRNVFGGYTVVREECESKELINQFLMFEGNAHIVIHIDTAEADAYGVNRPKKDKDYCENLRAAVLAQIKLWLGKDYGDQLLYAIAIEEIDAWVLTVYEDRNSTKNIKAKEHLNYVLGRKGIVRDKKDAYKDYLTISDRFSKKKVVNSDGHLKLNCSLKLFVDEVKQKIKI
jgi:hypothetical protein